MNPAQPFDRRSFLVSASLAAVSVAVPAGLWGCTAKKENAVSSNPEWEARAKALESEPEGLLSLAHQGKWEGKAGSHVPQVSFETGKGSVSLFTKHGMSEEHWITTHYLRNQDGVVIGLVEYQGTDAEARHGFALPQGTTRITAYSHCNLHGDWADEARAV